MKIAATLAIGFLASTAQASMTCAHEAVTAAKENSRGSTLVGIQQVDAGKSYLVGYDVAILNRSNQSTEQFRVILLTSDCSVVSITPAL